MNQHVPRVEAIDSRPPSTRNPSKGKEADDVIKGINKHVPRVEAIDSQRTLPATQSIGKLGDTTTKNLKKPVNMKLDFSHLRSTLDAISNENNTMSASLEEQQNSPMQQPEITNRNPVDPTAVENDATELKRKLEAMRNTSYTVPTTNVGHEQISTNSAANKGKVQRKARKQW
ncbi:hypothetical protein PIB30_040084 [Stylosanthes scabra]|uniref:Uncharacterized protein n=1 Tax=Stylosanthes scabra TaxID=79078 RepID=A0ABU6YDF1_9FABA|nr:hypothetical protein [Stylosanthes scabra]